MESNGETGRNHITLQSRSGEVELKVILGALMWSVSAVQLVPVFSCGCTRNHRMKLAVSYAMIDTMMGHSYYQFPARLLAVDSYSDRRNKRRYAFDRAPLELTFIVPHLAFDR